MGTGKSASPGLSDPLLVGWVSTVNEVGATGHKCQGILLAGQAVPGRLCYFSVRRPSLFHWFSVGSRQFDAENASLC